MGVKFRLLAAAQAHRNSEKLHQHCAVTRTPQKVRTVQSAVRILRYGPKGSEHARTSLKARLSDQACFRSFLKVGISELKIIASI